MRKIVSLITAVALLGCNFKKGHIGFQFGGLMVSHRSVLETLKMG